MYLAVLPGLMAFTIFRKFFQRMGFIRYIVFSNLILLMAALPIKMVLRWTLNLKYIVAIFDELFVFGCVELFLVILFLEREKLALISLPFP